MLNTIAAKATCFDIAASEAFAGYQRRVRANADRLAAALAARDLEILTGGTDTHMLVVDLRSSGWTGAAAESRLYEVGVAANEIAIPFDERPAAETSGLRLVSPALTMRGFDEEDMAEVAAIVASALRKDADLASLHARSTALCAKHPLYPGFRGYCAFLPG